MNRDRCDRVMTGHHVIVEMTLGFTFVVTTYTIEQILDMGGL